MDPRDHLRTRLAAQLGHPRGLPGRVIGLGDPDAMGRQPLTAHGYQVRPIVEVTSALHDAGLEVDQHRRVGVGEDAYHLLVAQAP